ncbi:MAG TPA: rhodanese-like domain-containing protein [Pyrinomonadaceae bacterium]|jgi:3-mercaptopyruvate sulfurtransferase SseA
MRLKYLYPAAALILTLIFTGCNLIHSKSRSQAQTPANTSTPYPDGARRVTIAELEALVKEDKAVVIDVRSQDSYDAGHIPGAKLIPSGEILNHLKELPRDKLIITYCS